MVIAIISLLSRHFGWYTAYSHTDTLLHIASGMMFGFLWLWLIRKDAPSRALVLLLTLVAVATFGSVLWELWEYLGHYLRPDLTTYYHPELGDTLSDIAAGMLGGFLSYVSHIW